MAANDAYVEEPQEGGSVGSKIIRNLGDMLLHISIDTDMWVGRSAKEKFRYLKNQLNGANGSKIINVGSNLLEGIIMTAKASTRNPVVRSYVDLAETALNLGKASMVINNLFVAQKYEVHTDYDELAKFMGYKNGRSIHVNQIDATADICKALVGMTKEQQEKSGLRIVKMFTPKNETPSTSNSRLICTYILTKYKNTSIGFEVNYMQHKTSSMDATANSQFSYINIGVFNGDLFNNDIEDDEADTDILSEVENIIYSNYIKTIDISKHIIKIDGTAIHTAKRENINFDIKNIDLNTMAKTCRSVLNAHRRRGYILQGDPGTGKTVSIHKLIMQFTDTPVFWISSDAISDTKKMRSVFRILNMFPGSIFVFDDIDGNDFSAKTNLTTTFITCIDETNSAKFSGIIIMTINEPQRVHPTIKARTGRIDEVIHVHNPNSVEMVFDVITQRYIHLNETMPEWMSMENKEFVEGMQRIVNANFTHAHVAGIISDLVDLYTDNCDCNAFMSLIDRKIESIRNASMVADASGHIETAAPSVSMQLAPVNGISAEAVANAVNGMKLINKLPPVGAS